MAIDRIDWHGGVENFPKELKHDAGGTHIGMFLAWAINNNLEGELHKTDSLESINHVKSHNMTGAEFLIKECDEKLWEDDLNVEGQKFAKYYYKSNKYYTDYETALMTTEPTLYHVQDTWENYDKLSVYIDAAFEKWLKAKQEKWWQFWR